MPKDREKDAFADFGADLKAARQSRGLSRRALAEQVSIDPRYLANIENSGNLPSLPVFYTLVKICRLPVEQYFFPSHITGSDRRQRAAHKLQLCPEEYLPIIEAALDGALDLQSPQPADLDYGPPAQQKS